MCSKTLPTDDFSASCDCESADGDADAQIGQPNPVDDYLAALATVFPDDIALDQVSSINETIAEAMIGASSLAEILAHAFEEVARYQDSPLRSSAVAETLMECAAALRSAGEILEEGKSDSKLDVLGDTAESALSEFSHFLSQTADDVWALDQCIPLGNAMAEIGTGFGDLLRALTKRETKDELDIYLAYFGLCSKINTARLLQTGMSNGLNTVFAASGATITQVVPCPFTATTNGCYDFYKTRISCTPRVWQRVLGGPGGPTGLYHIVCRWNVTRVTYTKTTTYRTRWDRFWKKRACTTSFTGVTITARVSRFNHYRASIGVPVALPGPFGRSC